ncbi:chorismate mutase [Buchnera aphidicola (Formosaphis micheliae)]|uniref:chorismate mutase n=1 Tax=Buchnera aphidicola TaxID=9 RepID=UPI0031B89D0A
MIYNNYLTHLRDKINKIDHDLIVLLSKRQSVVKKIAKIKIDQSLPIKDTKREHFLLTELIKLGEKYNINSTYIKNIFTTIIEYSIISQEKILKKKII